jgi:Kef-type K+ transport system membrane component KefB
LILGAARVVGSVLARVGEPRVVGEILAGFLLGPSLLGALPGDLTTELFPAEVRPV